MEPGPDSAAAALLQFSAEPLRMAAAIVAGDSLIVRLTELAEEEGCRLRRTGNWTSATLPLLPLLTCGNAVVTAAFDSEPGAGAPEVEVLIPRPESVILACVENVTHSNWRSQDIELIACSIASAIIGSRTVCSVNMACCTCTADCCSAVGKIYFVRAVRASDQCANVVSVCAPGEADVNISCCRPPALLRKCEKHNSASHSSASALAPSDICRPSDSTLASTACRSQHRGHDWPTDDMQAGHVEATLLLEDLGPVRCSPGPASPSWTATAGPAFAQDPARGKLAERTSSPKAADLLACQATQPSRQWSPGGSDDRQHSRRCSYT